MVVIDSDPERLVGAGVPHLVGDALDDNTLREAGIQRARALIDALEQDANTVTLTLSARALARTWSSWPGPHGGLEGQAGPCRRHRAVNKPLSVAAGCLPSRYTLMSGSSSTS